MSEHAHNARAGTVQAGTVHLVYPHGARVSTPDAIGRNVGRYLERSYRVVYHDWDERGVIRPNPGDVLVGHPHPRAASIFRRSARLPGWRRVIMLAPFHHGDLRQVAFEDAVLPRCDLFLAITGPYWMATLDRSACSHWAPKLVHVDLAVDRHDFPPLKEGFNPAGSRRIVYIGNAAWMKNTPYLAEIAAHLPGTEIGWIGDAPASTPGLTRYGYADFASPEGRRLVAGFDLLLMVSTADANPTTILEAMAWGLIPVCTPQCGYSGIPTIPNVPLGDAKAAAAILRTLLDAPAEQLEEMQRANWAALDSHYTWERFGRQVAEAIESSASPALGPESMSRRLLFARSELASPHGPLRRLANRLRYRTRALLLGRGSARAAKAPRGSADGAEREGT
jgi:glycosyltransferase involved in cell wall biosynthesis